MAGAVYAAVVRGYDARVTADLVEHPEPGPASPVFCPQCATRLRPRQVERRLLPACPGCGYIAFRDPKVVAVAVLADGDGRVWLIRRAIDPCIGQWALPGGYVDADEHPRDAAVRECREEIGCEVALDDLVGVHHARVGEGGVVVVAYAGSVVAGSPRIGPEVLEVDRFDPADPPPLAFATHREILADVAKRLSRSRP
jgi:8-oxo-dGTP diphosphatase